MSPHPQALYMIHALTPLRVGADQGIGAIDLPTLREAHTGWPIVPGSSVKGVLREQAEIHFGNRDAAEVRAIFGPPTELAGDYRGGMVFGDAYPLLLPVRSLAGTFAWVTCAQVLRRLERDAKEAHLGLELPVGADDSKVRIPSVPSDASTTDSKLIIRSQQQQQQQQQHVLFEDLCLEVVLEPTLTTLSKALAAWIWPPHNAPQVQTAQTQTATQTADTRAATTQTTHEDFLRQRLALVPDDVFTYLCRHRLEVRARVAIRDTTGTVAHGPWTEELIPAETVLCGIVQGRGTTVRTRKEDKQTTGRNANEQDFATDEKKDPSVVFADLRELLAEPRMLRLGGHGSVGLGRARVTLVTNTSSKESHP